jgi:hypothetical protein
VQLLNRPTMIDCDGERGGVLHTIGLNVGIQRKYCRKSVVRSTWAVTAGHVAPKE